MMVYENYRYIVLLYNIKDILILIRGAINYKPTWNSPFVFVITEQSATAWESSVHLTLFSVHVSTHSASV